MCASATNTITLGDRPLGPLLPLKLTETKCVCCQPGWEAHRLVWRQTRTLQPAALICAEWVRRQFSLLGDVGAGVAWKLRVGSFQGLSLSSEWPFSAPPPTCDLIDMLMRFPAATPVLPYSQPLGCCLTLAGGQIHLSFSVYKAEPVLGQDSNLGVGGGREQGREQSSQGGSCLPAWAPGPVLSTPSLPESLW